MANSQASPPSPPARPTGARVRDWLLSLGVTGAALAVLVHQAGARELLDELKRARGGTLAAMFAVSLVVNIFMASDKYMRLTRAAGCPVSLRAAMFLRLGTLPLKFAMPAKAGEFFKVFYLKKYYGFSIAAGTGTVVYDKVTNLAGMLLLLLLPAAFVDAPLPWWIYAGAGAALAAVLGVIAAVKLTAGANGEHQGEIKRFVRRFGDAGRNLTWRQHIGFIAYGVLFETSEVINTYLALTALGVHVPPATAVTVAPLLLFLVNIPVTVSGLGIRELSVTRLFASWAGVSTLGAAGALVSLVEYAFPALIGLAFLPSFLLATFGKGRIGRQPDRTDPDCPKIQPKPR